MSGSWPLILTRRADFVLSSCLTALVLTPIVDASSLPLRTERSSSFMFGRKKVAFVYFKHTDFKSTTCSFALIRCKWIASFNFSLMGKTCCALYFWITFLTLKPGRLWESLSNRTEWLLALWMLYLRWSQPTPQIKLVKMKGDNCSTVQKENRMISCSFPFSVQNKTHLYSLTLLSRDHNGLQTLNRTLWSWETKQWRKIEKKSETREIKRNYVPPEANKVK